MKVNINQRRYNAKYFLSPQHDFRSLKVYRQFLQGGLPPKVFLDAYKRLPKNVSGPFLDIGCGRGEMVIFLGRLGFKATGVDYSDTAISICRDNLKRESAEVRNKINFRKSNGIRLPFPDACFGCIFLLDVVEHVTPLELSKILKEVSRVLAKNGLVIVHTNNKLFEKFTRFLVLASLYGLHVLLRPRYYDKKYGGPYESLHINYMTTKTLESFFRQAGFTPRCKYVIPQSREELRQYLNYKNHYKEKIFNILAWELYHSPLSCLIAQSFWTIAKKVD